MKSLCSGLLCWILVGCFLAGCGDDDEDAENGNDDGVDDGQDDDAEDDDAGDDDDAEDGIDPNDPLWLDCVDWMTRLYDCDGAFEDESGDELTLEDAIESICSDVYYAFKEEYFPGYLCSFECTETAANCWDFLFECSGECEDDMADPPPCETALCTESGPEFPLCMDTVDMNGKTWTRCDNGEDISHYCAGCYAANLELAGHADWRLPTKAELQTLYDVDSPQDVECGDTVYITEPFDLSCTWVWTSEIVKNRFLNLLESSAWGFEFDNGTFDSWGRTLDEVWSTRALAVRP